MKTLNDFYIYPFQRLFTLYCLVSNRFSYKLASEYIASINSSDNKTRNLQMACQIITPAIWCFIFYVIIT